MRMIEADNIQASRPRKLFHDQKIAGEDAESPRRAVFVLVVERKYERYMICRADNNTD